MVKKYFVESIFSNINLKFCPNFAITFIKILEVWGKFSSYQKLSKYNLKLHFFVLQSIEISTKSFCNFDSFQLRLLLFFVCLLSGEHSTNFLFFHSHVKLKIKNLKLKLKKWSKKIQFKWNYFSWLEFFVKSSGNFCFNVGENLLVRESLNFFNTFSLCLFYGSNFVEKYFQFDDVKRTLNVFFYNQMRIERS